MRTKFSQSLAFVGLGLSISVLTVMIVILIISFSCCDFEMKAILLLGIEFIERSLFPLLLSYLIPILVVFSSHLFQSILIVLISWMIYLLICLALFGIDEIRWIYVISDLPVRIISFLIFCRIQKANG